MEQFSDYFLGRQERTPKLAYREGGDPANYADVDPELIKSFKDQSEGQPSVKRIKLFSQFLQRYTDSLSAKSERFIGRVDKVDWDVTRPEEYINSFNIMFGAVIEGLSPDGDFPERFARGEEIDEMVEAIYKLAPTQPINIEEIKAVGQRLKAVQFYASAKRDFFPELFPQNGGR